MHISACFPVLFPAGLTQDGPRMNLEQTYNELRTNPHSTQGPVFWCAMHKLSWAASFVL